MVAPALRMSPNHRLPFASGSSLPRISIQSFISSSLLDALIDIQEFRAHELLVNYRKIIVVAVEEVDNAIKQYRALLERQRDLGNALDQSRRAVDLATERYERGLTDFLNVLDAQRQEFGLEEQFNRASRAGAMLGDDDFRTVVELFSARRPGRHRLYRR